jgi:zinc/manganese transport system permease protein
MLAYAFMLRALAAASCVAVLAACAGSFLILRRQTFAGHALSHVGFAGAAAALLAGVSPLAGLVAFTVLGGVAMGVLGERLVGRDVAIGLVLAVSLAVGLVCLHVLPGPATQATALLFGNVLAVDGTTLIVLAGLCCLCLAMLAAMSRPLLLASLQPELARARGVRVGWLATLFLAVVAVAVALSAEVVGVLLVFALMVGPAAAGQRLAGGFLGSVAVAVALAVFAAEAGLTLAWYTDWPASACITALSCVGLLFPAPAARGRVG